MIHQFITILKNKSIYRVIWVVQRYFHIRDATKWRLNICTNLKLYNYLLKPHSCYNLNTYYNYFYRVSGDNRQL